ncbi:MAG: hypothetical protein FWC41_06905 [Firmicutes bacterium]|nr:hypothetical protein [Bacillota bacterium]
MNLSIKEKMNLIELKYKRKCDLNRYFLNNFNDVEKEQLLEYFKSVYPKVITNNIKIYLNYYFNNDKSDIEFEDSFIGKLNNCKQKTKTWNIFKRLKFIRLSKQQFLQYLKTIYTKLESNDADEFLYHYYHNSPSGVENPRCPICNTIITSYQQRKTCGNKNCSIKLQQNSCVDSFGYVTALIKPEAKQKSKETARKNGGIGAANPKTKEKIEQTNLIRFKCKNPLSNKDVIAKRNKTNEEKYGHKNIFGSEYGKQKIRETNKELYGCEVYINSERAREQRKEHFNGSISPFNLKENRDKSEVTTFDTYGVKCVFELEEFRNKEKEKQTKIENGRWISDDKQKEFRLYEIDVNKFSEKTLKKEGNEWLGDGWEEKRGRGKYHIDHKFSILEGFKQGIEPEIMGSKWNLRLITENENCVKGGKCIILKEELLKLYNSNVV